MSLIFWIIFYCQLMLCSRYLTAVATNSDILDISPTLQTLSQAAKSGKFSPEETERYYIASEGPIIPKILHQSWKTHDISSHSFDAVECRKLIVKYASDFTYILWTDTDIVHFIRTHYPEYLSYYKGLNMNIKRADFSRYLLLYHYGGLYMDLDIALRRPVSELVHPTVQRLEFVSYTSREFELSQKPFAGNAFFAAIAGSPIIKNMIEHTIEYANQLVRETNDVLAHSGPMGLGRQVDLYRVKIQSEDKNAELKLSRVVILNSTVVGNVQDNPSHAVHRRKHKW